MRTMTRNLEKMKLPTKHSGTTGESSRGCDETARRPPSVKAALSVSFGQRAPHRASTRDSSPVRRALTTPLDRENGDGSKRSPSRELSDREYDRARSRSRSRGRDRERRDRDRDIRHDHDGHYRDTNRRGDRERSYEGSRYYRESVGYRRSRSRYNSQRQEKTCSASTSSNLAKLKDLYGDLTNQKDEAGKQGISNRDSGTEEVIRIGSSIWK